MSPIEPLVRHSESEGLSHLENLQKIKLLLNKKGFAKELFKIIDRKNKGSIEVEQIQEAMKIIGFDFDLKICQGLMTAFDIDRTGNINLSEFIILLKNRATEVNIRIKNLSGQLIMTIKTPGTDPVDESSLACRGPRSRINSTVSDNSGLRDSSGRRLSSGLFDLFIPRYVPPSTGTLYLKIVDSQTIKPLYKVSTGVNYVRYS